jgi:hypothetical protein
MREIMITPTSPRRWAGAAGSRRIRKVMGEIWVLLLREVWGA